MSNSLPIFKILTPAEYQLFCEEKIFAGAPVDIADGFIHFSDASQVLETAQKHFGEHTEIWILEIATRRFGDNLKWEESRGGALFPHLYDMELRSEDIVKARLESKQDGQFNFEI